MRLLWTSTPAASGNRLHRSAETTRVGERLAFVGYTLSTGEEVFFTEGARDGTAVATDVSAAAS